MGNQDDIFNKIAQALLIDYSSVYYVDAETNEYRWYSIDPEFRSLQLEQDGKDFFLNMARDAEKVVYEEDKHIFLSDISREKLLAEMKAGTMRSFSYRLMIDGAPVYHMLRLIRGAGGGDDYFVLGVRNVDRETRARQEAEQAERERQIFNQITQSLTEHFELIFYVDTETGRYKRFSTTDLYAELDVPSEGDDFFEQSRRSMERWVHPEDREAVVSLENRVALLHNLSSKKTFTAVYRLVIGERTQHCRLFEMWASDRRHAVICVENINEEVAREESLRRTQAISVTYSQIAERLADHYDKIYYVDTESGRYVEFSSSDLLQALSAPAGGSRFFDRVQKDIDRLIYEDDRPAVRRFFDTGLLEGLQFPEVRQLEYRLMVKETPVYARLSAMYTKDRSHLLFCVENIDTQVRALRSANALARTDALTGTKNKNAYREQEAALQNLIDFGALTEFAVVVCDLNDLKQVNDTQGHKAGDASIRAAAQLVCTTFQHSPVYRIGGDEFVAVLRGGDYDRRDVLFAALRAQVEENRRKDAIPVVATGMSEFDARTDGKVADVFERADREMYECKRKLKERRN